MAENTELNAWLLEHVIGWSKELVAAQALGPRDLSGTWEGLGDVLVAAYGLGVEIDITIEGDDSYVMGGGDGCDTPGGCPQEDHFSRMPRGDPTELPFAVAEVVRSVIEKGCAAVAQGTEGAK